MIGTVILNIKIWKEQQTCKGYSFLINFIVKSYAKNMHEFNEIFF